MQNFNVKNNFLVAAFGFSLLLAFSALAEDLQYENFLVTRPQGYKLGSENIQPRLKQQEFVPEGETVTDWSEMMTIQIFYGKKDLEPTDLLSRMQQRIGSVCQNFQPQKIITSISNGYPAAMTDLTCSLNPSTGKPEVTVIRAIKGNDSLYVVQQAYRSNISREQIAMAGAQLIKAIVCDTRSTGHPCPDLKAQGFVPLKPAN